MADNSSNSSSNQPDIGDLFMRLPQDKQEGFLKLLKGPQLQRMRDKVQASAGKRGVTSISGAIPPGAPTKAPAPTPDFATQHPWIHEALMGLGRGATTLAGIPGQLYSPHETGLKPSDVPGEPPKYSTSKEDEEDMLALQRVPLNIISDTHDLVQSMFNASAKSRKAGEGAAASTLAGMEASPFGPAVKKAEEAGPGYAKFTPKTLGAIIEATTLSEGPKVVGEAGGMVKELARKGAKAANLDVPLRSYADKVMAKKLGVKPQEVATSPGLNTVREVGVQLRWGKMQRNVQGALNQIGPQIDAVATQAAAKGTKIMGIDKAIDAVYDPAIEEAKQIGGEPGKKKVARLQSEKQAAQTVVTQQGAKLGTASVNYAQGVDPIQALAKKRAIMNRGWEAGDPQYVKDLNRQLGHSVARIIDSTIPEMRDLNQRYAGLKDASEAIGERIAQNKVGLGNRMKGLLDSPSTLIMYGAAAYLSSALGGGFGGRYAGIIAAKALYDSLPSASARATVANWFADEINNQGVTPRTSFPQPKKVQPGPPPPGAPPAAPAAGPPGGAPPIAPVTPPPTGGGAGPGTAAAAPGVVAPGAAPQGSSAPVAAAPPPSGGAVPPAVAASSIMSPIETMTNAVKDFVSGKTDSAALRSIVEGAFGKGDRAELVMKQARDAKLAQDQLKATAPKPAAKPKVTKVPEGVSGFDEVKKKYFDMIPDIMARMDAAPNGMVRAALQKTFDNVKQILNPATDPKTRAELIKKVDKSLEKAEERAKSAGEQHVEKGATAETEVSETGGRSYEPLAPEVDMAGALDRVKELEGAIKGLKGGNNMLKAFDAKFGKLTAPDKAGELLAMYTFMKEHPEMIPGGKE